MPFRALFLTAEIMQAQAYLSCSRHIPVPGEKIMPEDTQEGKSANLRVEFIKI
jgi:hypothetical protein